MQEAQVRSLGQEDPLEKEMATHSSTVAWEIPQTEEPGGLQSMDLQRAGQDWAHTQPQTHTADRQLTDVSLAITVHYSYYCGMTLPSPVYAQAILSHTAPEPAMSRLLLWTPGGIPSHCCSLQPL